MNYQQHKNLGLFFHLATVGLILSGCKPQLSRPLRICSGKANAIDAISAVRSHLDELQPFKGNGQCLWEYYEADGKKLHKEKFPVKVWVNPPGEIYLQGDVAFDGKGVVLGSNEEEFWLSVKPGISSYWWGRWAEQDNFANIKINPKLLLEAFGMVTVGNVEDWSLSNESGFDILTKRDGESAIIKKIYIDSCNYRISKIEYFEASGQVAVVAELDEYEQVIKDFFVPGEVKIVNYTEGNRADSVKISLGSVKPVNLTQAQQNRLFKRREPRGFKHIYRIVNGAAIE